MAKTQRNRRGKPDPQKPQNPQNSSGSFSEPTAPIKAMDKRPVRWDMVVLFLVISIGGTFLAIQMKGNQPTERLTFQVLRKFDHDQSAFTQGLVMHDGFLWESTGKKGKSSFRKVELETGKVLQQVDLDDQYFGEGMTWHDGLFYQLTWKENTCFVYDQEMKQVNQFHYEGEGWGLTSDGTHLIMSDGTSALRFLDPETFEEIKKVNVQLRNFRVSELNELEYAGGKIFANVWMQDFIYEIDPQTGNVTRVIDLAGLWPARDRPNEGVLNGIAINPENRKLLVTGKYAPYIWEIEVLPTSNR